ncbi:MAG: 2-C-methyl-D-erythritol 2,4-cyclodiphosphate synthase [Deltaproteobacteria bacterium]|nr:MAG: 2-C-methyl-D-erythritol 2,4-cyclodiphosphate synthase [Deltaproteobacteria bacterium]
MEADIPRIGFGYDVHRLVQGRPLILGGLKIPFEKGLHGHSDADVLTHAVMDAILGAIGKGDIGLHFPDSDPMYKGANSLSLLKKAMEILHQEGFTVNNLDATIVAQEPKLTEYLDEMGKQLSHVLGVEPGSVNVKATTSEGLGYCGRGEGLAAYAVVTVKRA